eukprot:Skav233560  [mRNA]  locus=scaffold563:558134:558400:+ [translate_table: standard]
MIYDGEPLEPPDPQVTWGHPLYGGDSRSAQHELLRVRHVHAAETAFAAIRDDGSVVTWGHPEYGGVSAAVQNRLSASTRAPDKRQMMG